jgi:hypothetical protein
LHFLRDENAAGEQAEEALPDSQDFLSLRHRIIGARLRQARWNPGARKRTWLKF